MKKQILLFLIGGLTFLSIGAGLATSADIITIKPTTPKNTVVKYGEASNVAITIETYAEKGYVVKQLSLSIANNGTYKAFAIMEKY